MTEFLLAVCAVFGCAAVAMAVFAYRRRSAGLPLTHLTYLDPYLEDPMLEDFEEKWAAIEAAYRDQKGEVQ